MNKKIDRAVLEWRHQSTKSDSPYLYIRQCLYDPIIYQLVFNGPNPFFVAIDSNKPEIFLRNYRLFFNIILFRLNIAHVGRVSFDE